MKGCDSRTCIQDSDLTSETMQLLRCRYDTGNEKCNIDRAQDISNHQLNWRICKIRKVDGVTKIKLDDSYLPEV